MKNKPRKATSKLVAELAGVSQTTVSFVLNNVESANISEETRQRVLRAARELNYVPDMAARSLASGKSNNIALVLTQPHPQVFVDEYIPNILTGINQVTQRHGLRILVELVHNDNPYNVYAQLLNSKEAGGIIVNFNFASEEDIAQVTGCAEEGLPIVSLADVHPNVYSVSVDKLGGVRKAVKHLINLGHKRIGCISYAPANSNPHADDRLHVFRRVLEAGGVEYDGNLVSYGSYDPETGYEAMKVLLQVSPLPTAIYAMNDVMAFGAISAIQEQGLRIPQDIAIVGFDDIRLARYVTPALTTIYEPDVDHGRLAAEMLIELIEGKTPAEKHVKLATRLVVRQSCGASLRA
ncbi:MAG: LacI family DNA-binding transcriptional regulator [Anaerolineae bacterium]